MTEGGEGQSNQPEEIQPPTGPAVEGSDGKAQPAETPPTPDRVRPRRRGRAAIAAGLSLALTAAAGYGLLRGGTSEHSSEPTPPGITQSGEAPQGNLISPTETAAPPTPEAQAEVAINNTEVDAYVQNMAPEIIAEYDKDTAEGQFKYRYTADDGSRRAAVNVLTHAPSALGGKYGEYGAITDVAIGADGRPDPKTATGLSIFSSINNSGEERDPNRQGVFSFHLDKYTSPSGDPSKDFWTLSVGNQEGGYDIYTNDPLNTANPELAGDTKPLTQAVFQRYTEQAGQVFKNLQTDAPVDHIPPPAATPR